MKVFKGGYKIVSLLNIDITSDFTISGIYDDIKDSHGKPILVSEINVGGEKMNDAYTIVKQDNTDYIIEVYGYSLTIASDDSVTVASIPEITSIGTGLDLTDGELSVSGGGEVTLYRHTIELLLSMPSSRTLRVYCTVISGKNTAYTKDEFFNNFSVLVESSESSRISMLANGFIYNNDASVYGIPFGIFKSTTDFYCRYVVLGSPTSVTEVKLVVSNTSFYDEVVAI